MDRDEDQLELMDPSTNFRPPPKNYNPSLFPEEYRHKLPLYGLIVLHALCLIVITISLIYTQVTFNNLQMGAYNRGDGEINKPSAQAQVQSPGTPPPATLTKAPPTKARPTTAPTTTTAPPTTTPPTTVPPTTPPPATPSPKIAELEAAVQKLTIDLNTTATRLSFAQNTLRNKQNALDGKLKEQQQQTREIQDLRQQVLSNQAMLNHSLALLLMALQERKNYIIIQNNATSPSGNASYCPSRLENEMLHQQVELLTLQLERYGDQTDGCISTVNVPGRVLPVYNQVRDTTHFLYKTDLPAMSELSLCFLFHGPVEDDDDRRSDYLVSIAVPDQANEFLIGFASSGRMSIHIRNSLTTLYTPSHLMEGIWGRWRKHCYTWKAGQKFTWYLEEEGSRKMKEVASVSVSSSTIRASGHMTLLQEQDAYGSDFDLSQTVPGKITEFNMWNRLMDADELSSLTCGAEGNVASWDTLEVKGEPNTTYEWFPTCINHSLPVVVLPGLNRTLPVYNQPNTLTSYLYQRSLPALSKLSLCFWFMGKETDDRKGDYLVSLATPGQANEFLLGFNSAGAVTCHIRNDVFTLTSAPHASLFTSWHKHCFTWSAGGQIKWFTDKTTPGVVEEAGSVSVNSYSIRNGGYLTLLQEQDSFGGDFDASQTVPGKIAEFNMWSVEMSLSELNTLTCGANGNVSSWSTLLKYGLSNITTEKFPLCPERTLPVYTQERTTSYYLSQHNLPALDELTFCFWLNGESSDDWRGDYFLSLAVPAEANEFLVGFNSGGDLTVHIRDNIYTVITDNGQSKQERFVGWHKHCFTWKKSSGFKWYTDETRGGPLAVVGTAVVSHYSIRNGGTITILQEQDSFDGSFDLQQTIPGKVAEINMWNYEMTATQINTLTCGTKGNVVSWDKLTIPAGHVSSDQFPTC